MVQSSIPRTFFWQCSGPSLLYKTQPLAVSGGRGRANLSGWDLNQHKPKAMRKAVAAGAVYWFECCSDDLDNIHQVAFQSISDQEQDKLDGFGIVSVAAWQKK